MILVKKVTPAEVESLVSYIEKKAAFDREIGCFDGPLGTTAGKIHQALFGTRVFAYALLATSPDLHLGFAFYHYRFSSFQARPSLWLDDLYVDANVRRGGVGLALMNALASEALGCDCTHLGWTADARNSAGISFYRKLGATLKSQTGFQLSYSIEPEQLRLRVAGIQNA